MVDAERAGPAGLRQVVLLPVLNLTMVWNRGVTFGLLNGLGAWGHLAWLRSHWSSSPRLASGSTAPRAAWWPWRSVRLPGARSATSSIACVSAAVVDFIHAHVDTPWGDLSWYVFNIADAAIVCGVAALIFDSASRAPAGSRRPADAG